MRERETAKTFSLQADKAEVMTCCQRDASADTYDRVDDAWEDLDPGLLADDDER